MLFRVPGNMSHVEREEVLVEALRIIVFDVVVTLKEGVYCVLELVWEGQWCSRGSKGRGQSLDSLADCPGIRVSSLW